MTRIEKDMYLSVPKTSKYLEPRRGNLMQEHSMQRTNGVVVAEEEAARPAEPEEQHTDGNTCYPRHPAR